MITPCHQCMTCSQTAGFVSGISQSALLGAPREISHVSTAEFAAFAVHRVHTFLCIAFTHPPYISASSIAFQRYSKVYKPLLAFHTVALPDVKL